MYQPTNLASEQTTSVSYGTTYKMVREADPRKSTSISRVPHSGSKRMRRLKQPKQHFVIRTYELEQSPAPLSATNKRKRKDDTMAKANSQSNRRAVAAETSQPPSIEKAMDSDGFQNCELKPHMI